MDLFTLRTAIDDILLLVRNNAISESEDFSRRQIAAWVITYKAQILKEKQEALASSSDEEWWDDTISETKGPLILEDVASIDKDNLYTKRTYKKIPELLGNSDVNISAVADQHGHLLQKMAKGRRHFHWFRRYTHSELTWYYENGYIYVQGNEDCNALRYLWITGNWNEDSEDIDEDDVKIPAWMMPTIRNLILKNELSFMVTRPSDDSNNATLASIKPNGPQDKEK